MNIDFSDLEKALDDLLKPEPKWHQAEAVERCKKIEAICPEYGCHVALTGGSLYKEGPRKDCDLIFYRIRQTKEIDYEGLFTALQSVGVYRNSGFGWCHKATYISWGEHKGVDILFPEATGGDDIYVPKN